MGENERSGSGPWVGINCMREAKRKGKKRKIMPVNKGLRGVLFC